MPRLRNIVAGALLAAIPFGSSGCLAVVVGVAAAGAAAGSVLYVQGALQAVVESGPEGVVEASKSALGAMKIAVLSSSATVVDGKVVGRTAADTRVTIDVKRESDTLSRLWIRVGIFGDEPTSLAIFEEIKSRLGEERR